MKNYRLNTVTLGAIIGKAAQSTAAGFKEDSWKGADFILC